MKKTLYSLVVILLIVTGCSRTKEPVKFVEPQNIIDKFNNEDSFMFVIGDETDPNSEKYKNESLTELKKKVKIDIYYIDLIHIKDMYKAKTLVDDFVDGNFVVTPTTYFIEDGRLVFFENGVLETSLLESKVEEYLSE